MSGVAIFGCKSTTHFMVEALLANDIGISQLISIDPHLAGENQVADYCDLRDLADHLGIPIYHARKYSLTTGEDTQAIASFGLDIAFVIGWQRLLPSAVLQTLRIGAFGMHGSSQNLPIGRGRSPMNWSLIEGRGHFFTNLFRYDEHVDAGDVVDTLAFSIRPTDTAETMHFKNTLAMKRLIERNRERLLSGDMTLQPQPDLEPTYYPKRNPDDSIIDWRCDITQLDRFIRAVAPPFNGAFSYLGDDKVIISRAAIFETELVDFGYQEAPAGALVEMFPNGKFLVRCIGGLLLVHEHQAPRSLKRGDRLISPPDAIRQFPRNDAGFHDHAD